MGPSAIDARLCDGSLLVTASDRASRAITARFHRARRAEGLTAWPAPNIQDWNSFVGSAWEQRAQQDPRLLLNHAQERELWVEVAATGRHAATVLEGPRHRLADLAIQAHELLCSYAPHSLNPEARSAWQQDAAAFSAWIAAFDKVCLAGSLLSPARLPLDLISLLEAESAPRPPLLLAGFDRILPIQRAVFDAWGAWSEVDLTDTAASVSFYESSNAQSELTACALWCGQQLVRNPQARLLVITQDLSQRRGEIERAFLNHISQPPQSQQFEFSLGIPLSQLALTRAASLLLRWLTLPLAGHELDWLFASGYAADSAEASALQAAMRQLRRRSLQQPQWTLKSFASAVQKALGPAEESSPAIFWLSRAAETQAQLTGQLRRSQSPFDWAGLVPRLLESLEFATANPLQSAEHQAYRRWQLAVESAGSLGFDARRITWSDFLSVLARTLDETLFAPESHDAPIQIAGPAESAGLTADAIWFLGASEDSWPAKGSTHPLLPPEVQRRNGMPHATPQLDWDLAHSITKRLLTSAPEVHLSYARQNESVESRPSRLVAQLVGLPQSLPASLAVPPAAQPITTPYEDFSRIPFPPGKVAGGSGVLTAQSQCPFKAFATARLGAQAWEPAEAGLTASQRGNLLHDVLRSIWAGTPNGIRSHAELQTITEHTSFVMSHVKQILQQKLSFEIRDRMPRRYLELEAHRLCNLVCEWLGYESTRVAFEVAEAEAKRLASIAGLDFELRLDRIDKLIDGTLLVIDYKSGNVSHRFWDLPRPDDVQLPLYAGFALDRETEPLGGLVFAKIRPGKHEFSGRIFAPSSTVLAGLKSTSSLEKSRLSAELLLDWRDAIEKLAREFLAGRAEVNPRDYPETCERCGLHSLCRIQENRLVVAADEGEAENQEAADE